MKTRDAYPVSFAPGIDRYFSFCLTVFLFSVILLCSSFNVTANQENSPASRWISPLNGYYTVAVFNDTINHQESNHRDSSHQDNNHRDSKHRGIDVVATKSTRLLAPAEGLVVVSAETDVIYSPLRNVIVIDHGNDILTLYSNLKQRAVKVGDWVQTGQAIGRVFDRADQRDNNYTHIELIYQEQNINPFVQLPYRFFELELPPTGLTTISTE